MCEYPYQLANATKTVPKSENASFNDLSQFRSKNNSVIIEQI